MGRIFFGRAIAGLALTAFAASALFVRCSRDTRTVVIDGIERTYDVLVEGEPSADPVPLVFVFHGRNGSAWKIRYRTGIASAAHELGDRAVFVFPQGAEYPGGNFVAWQAACDGPDMRFMDAIVRTLGENYSIDRSRLFASGFSWGAEMAIAFGCCRRDMVRAIAPMSGGTWDSVDACREQAPAYRMTIGDNDPIVPLKVVQHVTDEFRVRQGCSDRTHSSDPNCRAYDDCRNPVIQCIYPGVSHEVPEDGGREIWKFLRSFPSTASP